ncbi:HD domain-containing protein [Hugenholtzia roseola]|uniref:HD domain-containing protein n=1 Tax=Hugenholtzia roseola TaxID=1002 RepID=UPI000404C04E|nr:HD domain-containing protein [Hugenholtzia roseola]
MQTFSILERHIENWQATALEREQVLAAARYAVLSHRQTQHFYGEEPYEFHLLMVFEYAFQCLDMVERQLQGSVLCAAWTHDLIEDCRQTYGDIAAQCGEQVAQITYALTQEKGRTRSERAGVGYYAGIRQTEGATFVKLCDRLANVAYSYQKNKKRLHTYQKEQPFFKSQLFIEPLYLPLWGAIDHLLSTP